MTKTTPKRHSANERKRLAEFVAMVVVALLLVGLSRLETRLFDLSKSLSSHQDFFTSVIYFGQINANVLLILILSWLIFRNVAKLVVDRRRGVIGSRLKMKLVISFVFFAVAPTALMFYISTRFITTSFDTWLSSQVQEVMQATRQAGSKIYEQDQRRLESLARIALQKVRVLPAERYYPGVSARLDHEGLKGFVNEYRLNAVKLYDVNGKLIWSSNPNEPATSEVRAVVVQNTSAEGGEVVAGGKETARSEFVQESIYRFSLDPEHVSRGTVENDQDHDVVKGVAPVFDPTTGRLVGVVLTEEKFEMRILQSIEGILDDFASLRPGAQLIRLSYLILLVVMVTIILFSATWLGFYVARGITTPIQSLAEASREVALGNYAVTLHAQTDDETGQLIRAFNRMTRDLRKHKSAVEASRNRLELTNEELERRRKYMEVILKNVNAGVISVDSNQAVTSVNNAAERLLGLRESEMVGKGIEIALGDALWQQLWCPIEEKLRERQHFSAQLDVNFSGRGFTFLVDGTRIYDEQGVELGVVLVFDDATEQVKVQRVAAWREVARRIAHEIKNPITPIMLNAQRLSRRYGNQFAGEDREIFRACLDTIISQVNSLKAMVNEFSKFSQLPAIRPQPQNVNDVVREVAHMYAVSYPDIQIDDSELDPALPQVMIDREQMQRVLVNLLANAIAAAHPDRALEIKVASRVDRALNAVRVEVADNGTGIAPEYMDRVTEPYFSTKREGTGLGLAIVNQVVAEHGGYLRLLPRGPFGTVVVVELPMGSIA